MAATSQPLATQAAIDTLRLGGTAVDAAIAANAVLCLVEPTGAGLGGDLFALVWDAAGRRLHGLNGSGRSPNALHLSELQSRGLDTMPVRGPLPVTVPGAVDGWFALSERFGRLPIHELFAPAIRHAREGFAVTEVIAGEWALEAKALREFPGFAETFMPGGRPPRAGEAFRNPDLADVLEKIATKGRQIFYEGEIAEAIAGCLERAGGFLTADDLAAHRSDWIDPVSADYRGYTVWELPPNGQGIAVLQMLNLLEGYDIAGMGFGSVAYLHHLTEAKKLVYEDRARYYADPAFSDLPVEELISKQYAARRRALIDPQAAAIQVEAGSPGTDDLATGGGPDAAGRADAPGGPGGRGDTVYLSVADRDGNMVSLIQSNYIGMGSGMVPERLGFVLQNRGQLFALNEDHPNAYAPGKRPFHTIIPGFVTVAGEPYMSFGVMGGDMQPQGQVQVLINHIDFGLDLQEAGDAPRARHVGSSQPTGEPMEKGGGTLWLEPGFSDETLDGLRALGHGVEVRTGGFGGYQAIRYDAESGVCYGASESRKDGCALGI